ncbi:MAG: acetyl-CoA hydrolase [Spirochaetae bacterium HGW-Spirochaetae-1]|nr:MAG: acetyl-CoA hydrolase [Spirochaetae bacterium HGW-Spirochaetae-1]
MNQTVSGPDGPWNTNMWQNEYKEKLRQPEQLINLVQPGNKVYIETGCSEPRFLVETLIINNRGLSDVEIFTTIPLSGYSDFGGKFGSRFRIKSFFISPSLRSAFDQGNADHMPVSTFGLSRLILEEYIPVDVALIQLGIPDSRGFMSLGVTVDITRTIIEKASVVIAQVNRNIPRTFGDGFIHMSMVDHLIEHDAPLIEYPMEKLDIETLEVGENIASLIDDGSTIQFGFGRIPEAALLSLVGKKDLGIHSEIITDTICDLMESGTVTNMNKDIDTGKTTASLCLGTRRLFDYLNDNPGIEMRKPEYVSNPQVIGSHGNMVAINGAVEVDLTGQTCVGMKDQIDFFGVLSHADFNRTAMLSPGGKGIIALRSTTRDGSQSRIVPEFTYSRSGIITTQTDTNWIVTEYGCVNLYGKSIRDRALALISIAHPGFRQWLLEEAKRLNFVYQDQVLPAESAIYPFKYEMKKTIRENKFIIRPVKITDERAIQDLFYTMPQNDKFFRFLRNVTVLHHQQAQPLVNADYINSMALVVTELNRNKDNVLAVAHIARENGDDKKDTAEFAAMVDPRWQNKGIGTYLLKYMTEIAGNMGFKKLSAYVWEDNMAMIRVIQKEAAHLQSSSDTRVITFEMDTEQ